MGRIARDATVGGEGGNGQRGDPRAILLNPPCPTHRCLRRSTRVRPRCPVKVIWRCRKSPIPAAMSSHTEGISVVLLSNRELCRMLDDAEREERSLSDRRKELHALIDDLSVNAPEDDFELVTLAQKERDLSAERLQLHQRILELRLEKGGRIEGLRTPLRIVGSPGA